MNASVLRPGDRAELCELIGAAAARGEPLELRGGGSKRAIGAPQRRATLLDMRAFSGVVQYEPAELVLTVLAGTPLSQIETLLAEQQQMLAFEPFDHAVLFGERSGSATIGGVVASNVAGPRRIAAGGVRDHLLGIEAVSGRAEAFKAGGRVVKNVTGYDLPRLMAGSWGRLAALTSITLKVLPRPRSECSLCLTGLADAPALALLQQLMGSSAEISAAAHVPAGSASRCGTLLRLEGFEQSVLARVRQVRELCAQAGSESCELLEAPDSQALWHELREVRGLAGSELLWRVVLPGAHGARLIEQLPAGEFRHFYDWAGGLVWIASAQELPVRRVAAALGGQAQLLRAPQALRARCSALSPEQPGVAALRARVKRAFDPAGIFDPNRFDATDSAHAH